MGKWENRKVGKWAIHWRFGLAGIFVYFAGWLMNQLAFSVNGLGKMPEVNLDGSFDVTPHLAILVDRWRFGDALFSGRTYSIGDGLIVIGFFLIALSLALLAVVFKRRMMETRKITIKRGQGKVKDVGLV